MDLSHDTVAIVTGPATASAGRTRSSWLTDGVVTNELASSVRGDGAGKDAGTWK
jgi:hypothetical protein